MFEHLTTLDSVTLAGILGVANCISMLMGFMLGLYAAYKTKKSNEKGNESKDSTEELYDFDLEGFVRYVAQDYQWEITSKKWYGLGRFNTFEELLHKYDRIVKSERKVRKPEGN